jgi:hypothetical protein
MISERTRKARAMLRKKTHLSPLLDNATRWSSKFLMLSRYSSLQSFLDDIVPVDLQLSPRCNAEVDVILMKLSQLDKLTKFLQSDSRHIYEVREALDNSIKLFPILSQHCSATAAIICDRSFESAICKIQRHQVLNDELNLSSEELRSVKHLKVSEDQVQSKSSYQHKDNDDDEMDLLLRGIKRRKPQHGSRYVDCRYIRPTSNICERLFSMSKIAIGFNRHSLLPTSLEMQLFLLLNRNLWDEELFQSRLE